MRVAMNAGSSIGSFSDDDEDDREKTATRLLARGSTWIWNDDEDDEEDETVSTSGSWCRESSRERNTYRWRDDVQQKHSNTNRRPRARLFCLLGLTVWRWGTSRLFFSTRSLSSFSLVRSFVRSRQSVDVHLREMCACIRTRQHSTEFLLSLSLSFLS